MPELEDQLTALRLDWPVTPDLAPRIRERLVRESPLPARWGGLVWGRPLAIAVAALLVVALALLAFPPSREAIANFLNLHTTVQRVPNPPTPSPLPSGTVGQRLGLGTPTTVQAAQSRVKWHVAVPSSLGQPDEVYYSSVPSQGEVSLVYTARPDIKAAGETGVSVLITEARGQVDEHFFGKMLGPDSTVEEVSVGGHRGWWISGHPHDFFFTDPDGSFRSETMRLATNTLIYDNNGTIVRIEADVTKDRAVQIASSMR